MAGARGNTRSAATKAWSVADGPDQNPLNPIFIGSKNLQDQIDALQYQRNEHRRQQQVGISAPETRSKRSHDQPHATVTTPGPLTSS
jgi:hypothetical protein